jgi:two-component system NtrC family response regulator
MGIMLSPILIIGGSKRYKALFTALSDLGIKTEQLPSVNPGLTSEAMKSYSAVVIEWDLPSLDRSNTLRQIQKLRPNIPVVALSSEPHAAIDGSARSENLADHLAMTGDEKEDLSRLLDSLKQFLPALRAQVLAVKDLFLIKTPSQKMKQVFSLVDIIKDEPSSVLIQGENGTGKEVIARLLHFSGRRHTGQFVAINCAAIPETLLESELFGHEKGSFTGATERRIGKFELAHKGTAFLDEIGDMPLNTQAKILRVLENAEIERVGSHEKIPVDIRIVAATNKNLLEQMENGGFRQDLYYRINTFTLNLPPLRERREDVLPLARHFLDMQARRRKGGRRKRLSGEAEQLLLDYSWPGNVRELRNAMERAVVLCAGSMIGPDVLPEEAIRNTAPASLSPENGSIAPAAGPLPIVPLNELEQKAIMDALSRLRNNATRAAMALGISKATLFRKLKEYGISRHLTIRT